MKISSFVISLAVVFSGSVEVLTNTIVICFVSWRKGTCQNVNNRADVTYEQSAYSVSQQEWEMGVWILDVWIFRLLQRTPHVLGQRKNSIEFVVRGVSNPVEWQVAESS